MTTAQTRLKRERKRSREIFERAEKVLVGGVNSPVRAFRSVGGEPLTIARGSGQHLYDGHGSDDERSAAGAGSDEARFHREIRRVLSRACGQLPVASGIRPRDPWNCR